MSSMDSQDRDDASSADRSKGPSCHGREGACGWGPFQPRALQPLATVWSFVVVYMAFSFTHGLQSTYTLSVLTTLEKRFNLPSYLSGLLVTISTCGYLVSVVFVSFFFAKRHPPRLFACSMLLTSLCALLYVIPHFVYGSGNDDIDADDAAAAHAQSTDAEAGRRLCEAGSLSNGTLAGVANGSCSEAERRSASDGVLRIAPALAMFLLSEFLQGVAGAPVWTVGLAYLDDHTGPELSAKLIGLLYSVRYVSPMIAFAMGGYCLSLYSTLSATTLSHDHPRWIGAWWLGFLVCFVVNLLLSIPSSMIPERLASIRRPAKKEKKEKEKEEEEEEKQEQEQEEEERQGVCRSSDVKESKRFSVSKPMPHWTELPKATFRLVSNPIYTVSSVAICVDCFVFGFMAFLPKYVEVQFGKAAWMANLLGGMIPAVFSGCSCYAGGILSGKIKGRDDGVTGNAWIDFVFSFISFVVLIPAMLIYCPESTHEGGLSLESECNLDCRCPSGVFDPVCGSDGRSYLSPCLAGCSSVFSPTANGLNDTTQRKILFADCRCITTDGGGGGGVGSEWGVVYEGSCDLSCDVVVIAYVIVLVLFFVAFNFYNVPCTNIILRCIDEADKSLALGLQTVGICLMIFPTPIIYGAVFDGTCILRESSPCSEAEAGDCLAYDRRSLRWALHGLTVGLRAVTTVLHFVAYVLAKRKLAKLVGAKDTTMHEMNGQVTDDSRVLSPRV